MFNQADLKVVPGPGDTHTLYVGGTDRAYIVRRQEGPAFRSHYYEVSGFDLDLDGGDAFDLGQTTSLSAAFALIETAEFSGTTLGGLREIGDPQPYLNVLAYLGYLAK